MKTFYLFIQTFVLIVFPAAYAAAGDLAPDMERILKKGKITVAIYYDDTPPFFMHDKKGDMFGLDIELARDIAVKLGVKLELNQEARTFDEVVELVYRKKADVAISMISNTLSRAVRVRFTDPYMVLYRALLINRLELARHKKKDEDIAAFLNNPGIKIGVIEGTSYVGFADEDFNRAKRVSYKEWPLAVKDVLEGRISAALYDEIEIKNWNRSHPESALYVQTLIMKDKKDPLSFAVSWEDKHLLAWLNLYLQAIRIDGTYDRLVKKYIGSEQWRKE